VVPANFKRTSSRIAPHTQGNELIPAPFFIRCARHDGLMIKIDPPKPRIAKGGAKGPHIAAQRWWRTLADHLTVEQAAATDS